MDRGRPIRFALALIALVSGTFPGCSSDVVDTTPIGSGKGNAIQAIEWKGQASGFENTTKASTDGKK